MDNQQDGRPGGLSSQATEPKEVSALRASIPDASLRIIRSEIAKWPLLAEILIAIPTAAFVLWAANALARFAGDAS